jgi:hypothetical protein
VNALAFGVGSPTPKVAGVDVTVTQKAAAGYTCSETHIRIIENSTGMLLDSHKELNPGATVTKSFANLPRNIQIQILVTANFVNGDAVDTKRVMSTVTTR